MKRTTLLLAGAVTLAGIIASTVPASLYADQQSGSIFVTQIPRGYRDWKLISVAHEEGNLNSFAAVLGNDAAIKAYRAGKLPFPDGAIIAALHYGGRARLRRSWIVANWELSPDPRFTCPVFCLRVIRAQRRMVGW
jgi:hypothetical protein